MNEARLELKIKNAQLFNVVMSKYQSPRECAKNVGIGYMTLLGYISLHHSPMRRNGKYNNTAIKLAEHFKMLEEDLFPEKLYRLKITKFAKEVDIEKIELLSFEQCKYLPAPEESDPFITICKKESERILNEAMGKLNTRQRNIIEKRFLENYSLEDTAKSFNITRERVRQIEKKAMAILREYTGNIYRTGNSEGIFFPKLWPKKTT